LGEGARLTTSSSEAGEGRVAAVRNRVYDGYMDLGFSEMVFLFILALLIFGPKKLPEVGRQIGRFMNDFKRASSDFKAQIESEINALESEVQPQILPPLHAPLNSLASRIFNPPPAAKLEAAEAVAEAHTEAEAEHETVHEQPPASKVAPDA
jgi:Tat protein translocase TatB subunit